MKADQQHGMNRRGFVTTGLGVGIFATGCKQENSDPESEARDVPASEKIFIALPGGRFYAVPEKALDPFEVDRDRFTTELRQKREMESRGDHLLDQSLDVGPEGAGASSESAATREWEEWIQFVGRMESQSLAEKPDLDRTAPTMLSVPVAGVRG